MLRESVVRAPVYALEADAEDRVVWFNEFTATQNDIRIADVIGLKLGALWADTKESWAARVNAHRTRQAQSLLESAQTRLGCPVWLDTSLTPRPDGGLFILCVDVTAKVQLNAMKANLLALTQPLPGAVFDPADRQIAALALTSVPVGQIAMAVGLSTGEVTMRLSRIAR